MADPEDLDRDDVAASATEDRIWARLRKPRQSRDWRWFVGGTGRVLIATGILLFAFVAYQLWGTGIEEARQQNRLESAFEDFLADLATTVPPTTVPPTTTAPPATNPSESAPTAPEPPVTEPPRPSEIAPVQLLPPVEPGDPVGIIRMPTINVEKFVVAGVHPDDLKKGPGHFSNTPLPGQLGNAGIAGHRTTFGEPFKRIDELDPGDPIIVTTPFGEYTYRVTHQTIVGPNDGHVLATVDQDRAMLTLVSCHPRYSARQRIIVFADLDEAASSPVGQPLIQYVPWDTGPTQIVEDLPGDESLTEEQPRSTEEEPAGEASADETALPTVTTTIPVGEPIQDEGLRDELEEAFGRGWFSDPGAWPHVAGWGVLLALIGIGATLLSRLTRRNWVGALVGIGPFVVVLYFWFQNVNRLLPPSL